MEPIVEKTVPSIEDPSCRQGDESVPAKSPGTSAPRCRTDSDRPVTRRIAKNFLSLSTSNLLCKLLAFVSTAYVARTLTSEGFGVIGFAQATSTYFQLLINQGLYTYGARETARHPSQLHFYVNNIVTMRLILAVIAYSLLVLYVTFLPKAFIVKAAILILGARLFGLIFDINWVFQGNEKMEWIAARRIVQQLVYVFAVFLLVHNPGNVLRVASLQLATSLLGAALLFGVYLRNNGEFSLSFDAKAWKEIFVESIPMATSYLLIQIYMSFDLLMLGFTHGERTVGYYNATFKLITMINMFGIYYFMTIFPNVSRLYAGSHERLLSLLSNSVKLASMIAVPIAVGGFVLAGPIIHMIYGGRYHASTLPLQILIWNIPVVWISIHYGNSLLACNRQKKYLKAVSMGAAVNIVFNLVFIPRYGMPAAALTTVFAEVVVLAAVFKEFRRIVPLGFMGPLARQAVAASFMGLVVLRMPELHVLLRITAGAAIYFPALYILGGIDRDDMNRVMTIIRWRKQ